MRTKVISIGNSRGIRIPKILLEESGITNDVEVKVSANGLRIYPIKTSEKIVTDTALLSEKALALDWNRTEEDEAWRNL